MFSTGSRVLGRNATLRSTSRWPPVLPFLLLKQIFSPVGSTQCRSRSLVLSHFSDRVTSPEPAPAFLRRSAKSLSLGGGGVGRSARTGAAGAGVVAGDGAASPLGNGSAPRGQAPPARPPARQPSAPNTPKRTAFFALPPDTGGPSSANRQRETNGRSPSRTAAVSLPVNVSPHFFGGYRFRKSARTDSAVASLSVVTLNAFAI